MTYGTAQWRRALSAIFLFVVLVFSLTTTASFASPFFPVALGSGAVSSNVKVDSSARGVSNSEGASGAAGASSSAGAVSALKAVAGSPEAKGAGSHAAPSVSHGSVSDDAESSGTGRAGREPLVVIGFSGVLWKNVTPELMPNLRREIPESKVLCWFFRRLF